MCSLGGNTKTAIICTVTAGEEEQTKSTLEFASRAKSIVNHAEVSKAYKEIFFIIHIASSNGKK